MFSPPAIRIARPTLLPIDRRLFRKLASPTPSPVTTRTVRGADPGGYMRLGRLFLSISIFLRVVQPILPVNSGKTIIDTAFPILPASQLGPPAIVEDRMIAR